MNKNGKNILVYNTDNFVIVVDFRDDGYGVVIDRKGMIVGKAFQGTYADMAASDGVLTVAEAQQNYQQMQVAPGEFVCVKRNPVPIPAEVYVKRLVDEMYIDLASNECSAVYFRKVLEVAKQLRDLSAMDKENNGIREVGPPGRNN